MKPVQVIADKRKRGITVVIRWNKRSGITTRSAPWMRKRMPIRHSKSPNKTMKVGKETNETVSLNNFSTKGLAGLKSMTFNIPNQKKMMKRARRAKGIEIVWQK